MALLVPAITSAGLTGCAAQRQESPPVNALTVGGSAERNSGYRPSRLAGEQQARPAARVVSTSSRDASIRRAAAEELGPETAASMPQVPPAPPPTPIDAGAAMIVRSIDQTLSGRAMNEERVTVVSMNEVRNLSRCGHGEFASLMQRLASLLSDAGREAKITFTDDAAKTSPAHYRMQGTAYLITAEGFDQWEMYLSVTPANRDFTVWEARQAIRVLRTPRQGQPQIAYIGK